MNTKKLAFLLLALFLAPVVADAQGNGMAGINEATKMVTSYFDPGTKLIYAIGAVVGLIGDIKVYNKFSSVTQIRVRRRPLGSVPVSFSSWRLRSCVPSSCRLWPAGKSIKA